MTTPTRKPAVTVTMPEAVPWGLATAVTAAGAGLGFAVAPLVRWMISTLDSAPWPLRLLAELPTGWAVLVTGLLGLAAGVYVVVEARRDAPVVTVAADHVGIDTGGHARWIDRAEIAAVLRDGRDLVLRDEQGTEPVRLEVADLSGARLRAAFAGHGYPWREEPGYGDRFDRWVDGRPGLDTGAHDLLRARSRALAAKDAAEVADLRRQLAARGVVVRDRRGQQEVRVAACGMGSGRDHHRGDVVR